MKRILLTISFLLVFASIASAEYFICYNTNTNNITKRVSGDCKALNICSGYNNQGMLAGCFIATKSEYDLSRQSFKEINPLNPAGARVVDMKQSEIDKINSDNALATTTANRSSAKALFNNETYLKAFLQVLLDEFNRNRTWDGKPAITVQDLKDAINAEIDSGNSD